MTLILQRENSRSRSFGTDAAIYSKSSGPYPPPAHHNTWGGARNSASRQSDSITLLKAVELVEAAQQAIAVGLPFNRHLTVHWERAKLNDFEAANATGRLLKLISDWVRRHGSTAYAWVRENGDGKGSHTHILLHVPSHLSLGLSRRWYRTVTGWKGRLPRGAVRSVCIGGTAKCAFSGSELYEPNLANVVGYILKGVDCQTGTALDLDRYGEGGTIMGKRVSISGSLREASHRR